MTGLAPEAWPVGAAVTVGLLGLAVGSFLNVVILRLPEGRSLWRPASACPGCGTALAWHDNVPVLSFLALRGRCRTCGMAISWQYPLVEIVTAAVFLLAWLELGPSVDFVVAAVFLAALVAITGIDLRHRIIPDVISLPGILAGLVASLATQRVFWLDSVLGILVGGGVFLAIVIGYGLVTGTEGMGLGDAKLGAMLGAFLGWKALLFALFVSILLGGTVASALLAVGGVGRKDPIPFGPFLAFGGLAGLFWGERVVEWYLSGFGR